MTEPSPPAARLRPLARAAAIAAFAVLLAIVAFTAFQAAYADALCCGDDAAMAVVAKNLVHGAGYSISVELYGQPGIFPFRPDISTGPSMIFPAALAVAVFGNRTWVPGAAEALIVVALLGAIAWYAGRRTSAVRGAAFGVLLIVGALGVTILHFEHWHALLGELPAALYAILGMAALSLGSRRRAVALAGGVCLGLAVSAKLVAVLAVAGYAAVAVARIMYRARRAPGTARSETALLGWTLGGAALPVLAFEAYKLISLGAGGYAANTRAWFAFVDAQSAGRPHHGSILAAFVANAAAQYPAFGDHFGFSLLALALVCAFALAVVLTRARHGGVRFFACALASGSAVSLGWWLFVSIGWPRYALIGLILAAALIACAAFARPASCALVGLLLLAVIVRPHAATIAGTVHDAFARGFVESERVRHLHETTAFLAAHRGAPLLGGWWGTYVELEYTLPGVGNFTRWDYAPPGTVERDWLVRDEAWVGFLPQPGFPAFESRCRGAVWRDAPYVVTSCAGASRAPGSARGHLDEVRTVPAAPEPYDAARRTIVAGAGAEVTLRGWAIPARSAAPGAGVFALVDGRFAAGSYGADRPDVARALGTPASARSGFLITLRGARYGRGKHTVVLAVRSGDGKAYEPLGAPIALDLR